jgi:hypothetical protein
MERLPFDPASSQAAQEALEAERLQAETELWVGYVEAHTQRPPFEPIQKPDRPIEGDIDLALFALLEDSKARLGTATDALSVVTANLTDMEALLQFGVDQDEKPKKPKKKGSGKAS